MSVDRTLWRMTRIERTILQDLAKASQHFENGWVPAEFYHFLARERKNGNPFGMIRGLTRQGFIQQHAGRKHYKRTSKPLPQGMLRGADGNLLPQGAIARAVQHWKDGVRQLTHQHLIKFSRRGGEDGALVGLPTGRALTLEANPHLFRARKDRRTGGMHTTWAQILRDHMVLEDHLGGWLSSAASYQIFRRHRPLASSPAACRSGMSAESYITSRREGKMFFWRVNDYFRGLIVRTTAPSISPEQVQEIIAKHDLQPFK